MYTVCAYMVVFRHTPPAKQFVANERMLFIVQVHQLSVVPAMVRGLVQYFSMRLPALDLRLHCFHAAAMLSEYMTVAILKMLLLFAMYHVSYCTDSGMN